MPSQTRAFLGRVKLARVARQIIGYYNSRQGKLLKDFDRTSALMKDSLIKRYGEEFAKILQKDVRQEYEKLIPEIPYIKRGPWPL